MDPVLVQEIYDLIKQSANVFVSSVDEAGYPNTKAMFALERRGFGTYYLSTNFSARRTGQFMKNPRACLYFCSGDEFKGLMLTGRMSVHTDREHKALLWRDGFERYYPGGIDDDDYCVLEFTAERGNYYYGLKNTWFDMEDMKNGQD